MDWKPNAQQIKQDFGRDGYVVLLNHLSAEDVFHLRENVERYVAKVLPGLSEDEAFYEVKGDTETIMRLQRMQIHDGYFRKLYLSEQFLGLAHHLGGSLLI